MVAAELFRIWLNLARSGAWFAAALFVLPVAYGLALNALALFGGGLIVAIQLTCILELVLAFGTPSAEHDIKDLPRYQVVAPQE